MNIKISGLLIIALFIISAPRAQATVTLLDQDGWKFLFSGFAELDMFNDSTRGLTEVAGNYPIDRPGTYGGDDGRTQFSMRNSRFAFTGLAPVVNDWVTKGYLEFDLLGYDPQPMVMGGSSEMAFLTNPSVRLRHAYVSAEKDDFKILAGQTWTLFGWEPDYVLTTVSVAPVAATLYERTPQVLLIKRLSLGEDSKIEAGLGLDRPEQVDSELPNLDLGLRWLSGGRRSAFSSANSDIKTQTMSLGISATFRQYDLPDPNGNSTAKSTLNASAVAADILIPILASSDGKDPANTLTLTSEFTSGSGYGEQFPGWTGNLPTYKQSDAVPTTNPNMDPGIIGTNSSGQFQLVQAQTWNGQLQYYFGDGVTFTTAGYGQLYSANGAELTPTAGNVAYDKSEVYFLNLFHDFTKQVRVAAEYDRFNTSYADSVTASDNRYQISAWFRF